MEESGRLSMTGKVKLDSTSFQSPLNAWEPCWGSQEPRAEQVLAFDP